MKKLAICHLIILVVFLLTGCESMFSTYTYPKSSSDYSSTPVDSLQSADSLTPAVSTAGDVKDDVRETSFLTEHSSDYTYHFKDGENEYFLDWMYTNDDQVFNIDKNCGIFIVGLDNDKTMNRLFETSLKKELQALGYKNIVLASYSDDFDFNSSSASSYALLHGCLYEILFMFESASVYENGGGLSGSTSILAVFDIGSAFRNATGQLDCVQYDFIVSSKNNFQSYNSSLVTFNGFMAKEIMKAISVHLTGEDGIEDCQTFFEYGQDGSIIKYLEPSENAEDSNYDVN